MNSDDRFLLSALSVITRRGLVEWTGGGGEVCVEYLIGKGMDCPSRNDGRWKTNGSDASWTNAYRADRRSGWCKGQPFDNSLGTGAGLREPVILEFWCSSQFPSDLLQMKINMGLKQSGWDLGRAQGDQMNRIILALDL